jgi:hypothetical protein
MNINYLTNTLKCANMIIINQTPNMAESNFTISRKEDENHNDEITDHQYLHQRLYNHFLHS